MHVRSQHFIRSLSVLALGLFLALQGTLARAADYDHRGLARQALEAHIRPGYSRLADTTGNLVKSTAALCETPSTEALEAARQAFRETVVTWAGLDHLRFGPIVQEHRYERMAFWPDVRGLGRRQVWDAIRKKDESVLDAASLSEKSVALQGLTALEMVLYYGKGAEGLVAKDEASTFRCGFALSIARNLDTIATRVRDAWDGDTGFARKWLNPGPDNAVYRKESEVTLEIVKAFNYGLELVRDSKLVAPLGMHSPGGKPGKPQYAESKLSIPSIVAGVEGVKHLYEAGGLKERLEGPMPGMAEVIEFELANILRLASEIPFEGPEAFTNEESKGKLVAMGYPLKNAVLTGGGALGHVAGLTIGFNAGDGD